MIAIEARTNENLLLEPNCLKKAMSMPNKIKWDKAINSKFYSLTQNETWTLIDLPLRQIIVRCKWI
jgi:hypothetical protein